MLKNLLIVLVVTLGLCLAVVWYIGHTAFSYMTDKEIDNICWKTFSELFEFIKKSFRLYFINKETEEIKALKKAISSELDKSKNKGFMEHALVSTMVNALAEDIIGRQISIVTKLEKAKDGYITNGWYSPSQDLIWINSYGIYKAISQHNSASNYNKLLKVMCHELRHAWQYDNNKYLVKDYIASEDNFVEYRQQRNEVDARRFALLKVLTMSNERKAEILTHCLYVLTLFNK